MYNLPNAIVTIVLTLPKTRQFWAVASLLFASMILGAQTLPMDAGYGRAGPYPAYRRPTLEDYNLKWGRLQGHLDGSLQAEYNDNVFLGKDGAKSDFSLYPNLMLGFLWPVSRDQNLRLDLGIGYLWYARFDQLSHFYIRPNSRLEYQISVPDANLQFLIHDSIGTSVDPTSRPEISGLTTNNATGIVFLRLYNTAGLDVRWQPTRPLKVSSGYEFTLDRSLSEDFLSQDRDTHAFNLGADYDISSVWTVGLLGNYTINNYVESVMNKGESYTIGPRFTFAPMRSVSVFGSMGYTVYQFDSTGTVADRSDFSGVTFEAGVRQTLSRALSHRLQFGRSVESGWLSNFTELWRVQYGLDAALMRNITVNALLTYENFAVSGSDTDKGDRYLARLGAGYRFARRWNAGLAYYFALKDTEQTVLDYTQNRVSLELTHSF